MYVILIKLKDGRSILSAQPDRGKLTEFFLSTSKLFSGKIKKARIARVRGKDVMDDAGLAHHLGLSHPAAGGTD